MTETYSISNPSHFNGTTPQLSQLETEIANSSIATSVSYSMRDGDVVDIIFVSTISGADKTTLDGLVSSHTPTISPQYTPIGTIVPRNTEFSNSSYMRIGTFVYPGTKHVDDITKVSAISYKDSGVTSYSIRIFDNTNSTNICSGTFTNNTESVTSLTTMSNMPAENAIFEAHIKTIGGTGNQKMHIDSITFYT